MSYTRLAKVYFGVQRGMLQLILESCRMPLEKVTLDRELKLSLEVEKQGESSTEAQVGTASSFKKIEKKSAKIKDFLSQVQQTGGEQSPKWIFISEDVWISRGRVGFAEGKTISITEITEISKPFSDFPLLPL